MTHMHVAGSIHADATSAAPVWLEKPTDANALVDGLWSGTAVRGAGGEMHLGGLPVTEIIEQAGSPVYVIDELDFRGRALTWAEAFEGWKVYYAGKSFLSGTIARWVQEEGLNLDVCSLGELTVALRAGFDAARIGLHGNNKSEELLRLALTAGVGRIIVDSADEIARLERLGAELSVRPDVLIRVTTGVEAHTHEYIATAHEDQKFGFSISGGQALVALVRCHGSAQVNLVGIHSHIGSQIFDTNGFEVATRRTLRLMSQFKEATGVALPELDLGGGFGIAYTTDDSPATAHDLARGLAEIIDHECRAFGLERPLLSIEPGRAISGPAGTALYTVGTIKDVELGGGQSRRYISVDGGMSDNIRPALYAAEYSAVIADRVSDAAPTLSRVVGLHCEGGDILVRDTFLPRDIRIGDVIAVPGAGAYSRSMASNYNHTPRPPVVAVRDGRVATIIRRETLDDLLALDAGLE
ncbi:diaminopimelate decarboxylase [Propioniciclava coleopterorum]|uniref:Diaminopimelate decarboxylase n=1 Tax=Propioniciclava coleopterorum TaxID=2714937 RepID=A0A6G7Y9B4_9ACTN|nr:diaminopimelate decarboxylase [Propioniciclava coleopterorum]QIK73309.1 diaminopimelate decarboxylase [Propioniciclava coleopterorum]